MKKDGVQSKHKIIVFILCAVLVVACVAGIVIATAMNKQVVEEVVQEIFSEKMSVSDIEELEKVLLADENITITLTEDFVVEETLKVNGDKRLCGSHSITMALDAEEDQNILHVTNGSMLILDGATIDGNSIASGIYVEEGAKFTLLSGEVIYALACGLEVDGEAVIKGGKITETMHSGVYVGSTGKVEMTAGRVVNNVEYGVYIASGGYMNIIEKAVVKYSDGYLLNVSGTCDVVGVELKNAGTYLGRVSGTLNISQKEGVSKKLECSDADIRGFNVDKDGVLNLNNVYLHDVGTIGVNMSVGAQGFNITNSMIEGVSHYGLVLRATRDAAVLKDLEIKDVELYYGICNDPQSVAEMENITITNVGERAIGNMGGTINAKNITVNDAKTWGVTTSASGNFKGEVTISGLVINGTGKRNALNCNGSVLNVSNATLNDSYEHGVRVHGEGKVVLKDVVINKPKLYGLCAEPGSITFTNLKINEPGARGIASSGGTITGNNAYIDAVGSEHGVSASVKGKVSIKDLTLKNVKKGNGFNVVDEAQVTIDGGSLNSAKGFGARAARGGKITLKAFDITECGNNALYVEKDSKVTLTNSTLNKIGSRAVYNLGGTVELKTVKIPESPLNAIDSIGGVVKATNVVIDKAAQYGISATEGAKIELHDVEVKNPKNRGIAAVGGTVTGDNVKVVAPGEHGITASSEGVINLKKVTITDVGKNSEIENANGINATSKAVVTITGGNISNIKQFGARAAGGASVSLDGVDIDHTGKNALIIEQDSKASLTDAELTNIGSRAIYNQAGTVELEDVKIFESPLNAIDSEGGVVKATNVVIDKAAQYGISVTEGAKIELHDVEVKNPKNRGIAAVGGTVTGDNVKVVAPGEHGITASSEGVITLEEVTITDVGKNSEIAASNGINATSKAVVTITGGNISNIKQFGARAAGGASVSLDGVDIDHTGKNALIIEQDSKASLTDAELTNIGSRAIYNQAGTVELEDVKIFESPLNAIDSVGGVVKATNVLIDKAAQYGIYADTGAQIELHGVEVTNPTMRGVATRGGTVTGDNVKVVAPGEHGITASSEGVITLEEVTITDVGKNSEIAASNGINATSKAVVTIIGGNFSNIKQFGARAAGGATVSLTNVEITGTGKNGLYIEDTASSMSMTGGKISGCTAKNGAGVYAGGTFEMTGGEISDNHATGIAGAVYVCDNQTFTMNDGIISNNSSKEGGGAIKLLAGANFTMNGGKITNNRATGTVWGAAIHAAGNNQIQLLSGEMSGNVSTNPSTYGDKNAIQASGCSTTTQITIGSDFDMGENSIRLSGVTANRTTPVLKITGDSLTKHNASRPLYIAMSVGLENHIQVECDSNAAATEICLALISAENIAKFSVSGSKIVSAKK